MADPQWPSKIHNGLVNPIMARLNLGIKVKSRCQLINKLKVACSSMAKVLTFGQPYDPRPSASGHYGCPQANTKAIPLQAIINI